MLETLGNLGEFVGAVGVILSLLYLSWEVRRNTKIQLRSNHRALQEELHASVRPAVESLELANLVSCAMENLEALKPGERYQVDLYMMSWLQNAELALLDRVDGLLTAETVEPYQAAIAGHLRSPGGRQWWGERRHWFTGRGQGLIDGIIEDVDISGQGAGVGLNHG